MTEDVPERLRSLPTWMLSQAAVRSHRLLAEALAGSSARGHHFRLLAALEDQGPSDQATLGRRTALDRSDVAVGVDELERRGLARRAPDPEDGRRKRVQITDSGSRYLAELDHVLAAVQDELLRPLDPAERGILLGLLAKLQPRADGGAPR